MPKEKKCQNCGLEFNDDTKNQFYEECHTLKDGTKKNHYRYKLCKKCKNLNNPNRNREYIRMLKGRTACKDCKQFYPYYIMQFDHLKDKEFNIASSTSKSRLRLLKEISKCELVCANCHASRTHKRKMQSRLL